MDGLDKTNKEDKNSVHNYALKLGEAIYNKGWPKFQKPKFQKLFDESNEHAAFKQWTKN